MPADEISQIESELRKLREVADHEKIRASGLEKEKKTLEARNEYLVNKMKEASYVYGEAGKRLLYFINNQVNPLVERLNRLEAEQKKAAGREGVLGDSVLSTEKVVREDFAKLDARIETLTMSLSALHTKMETAIKATARRSDLAAARIERKLAADALEEDKKLQAFGAMLDKRQTARAAAFERAASVKINALKEKNLLITKDMEKIAVLRKDIDMTDGKLQAIATHITQMRIDMEKASQRAEADAAASKDAMAKHAGETLSHMEKSLLSFSAQLRDESNKGIAAAMLAVEKARHDSETATAEAHARLQAMETVIQARLSKTDAALKKDFRLLSSDLEKRMKMLSAGIARNEAVEREFEKSAAAKFDAIAGKMAIIDDRIGKSEDRVLDDMEFFKQSIKGAEANLKAHVGRLEKAIDSRVTKAVTALDRQSLQARTKMSEELTAGLTDAERKIGLLAKDVATMKSGLSIIQNMNAELARRKEETAALQSRVSAIAKDISDKSEKEDMRIARQVEVMETRIKGAIESAESRMVRENVKSFAAARHSLRKDIQTLREENASLKAEVRNLKAMGALVTGIQQRMAALDKKFESSVSEVEKVSASVTAGIENQALRSSKEIAGFSSGVRAELKDILSSEKERFAAQSADVAARYAAAARKMEAAERQAALASATGQANGKAIGAVQADMKRLAADIALLRKRYAAEMAKLMKEIEG
jgi:hypothetical protein